MVARRPRDPGVSIDPSPSKNPAAQASSSRFIGNLHAQVLRVFLQPCQSSVEVFRETGELHQCIDVPLSSTSGAVVLHPVWKDDGRCMRVVVEGANHLGLTSVPLPCVGSKIRDEEFDGYCLLDPINLFSVQATSTGFSHTASFASLSARAFSSRGMWTILTWTSS